MEEKEAAKTMAEAFEKAKRYAEKTDASMKSLQESMRQIEVAREKFEFC